MERFEQRLYAVENCGLKLQSDLVKKFDLIEKYLNFGEEPLDFATKPADHTLDIEEDINGGFGSAPKTTADRIEGRNALIFDYSSNVVKPVDFIRILHLVDLFGSHYLEKPGFDYDFALVKPLVLITCGYTNPTLDYAMPNAPNLSRHIHAWEGIVNLQPLYLTIHYGNYSKNTIFGVNSLFWSFLEIRNLDENSMKTQ